MNRTSWSVCALVFTWCVASCGDPAAPSAGQGAADPSPVPAATQPLPTTSLGGERPSPSSEPRLPATTLVTQPKRNDALVTATRPVTVTEPCPTSGGGPDGSDAMFDEMSSVEPMLGVALQYGGQHREQFGSYGLVWHGTNDASVFISFTADLDVHREALRSLVAYPDELIVCQVAVAGDVANALAARLVDEIEGHYQSVGVGMNGVEVVLMPGEAALAADLTEEYGDALTVIVGSATEATTFLVAED